MIAVDTSAICAIVLSEPEAEVFESLLTGREVLVGAPTLVETHQVLSSRLSSAIFRPVERFLRRPGMRVVSFDAEFYRAAVLAFDRYGKGRGHPAQLNFGDCLSYAVATTQGVPLLYKGDDFTFTDLTPAFP